VRKRSATPTPKSGARARSAVTYDTVRRIGLALPDVEDSTSYGTPALKVKGKLFVRLRPDLDALVVKTTFARRDELLESEPDVYFLTDHYVPYEWVLVRFATVRPEMLPALLEEAHALALPRKKQSRAASRPSRTTSES
jgi:hypothetical protein